MRELNAVTKQPTQDATLVELAQLSRAQEQVAALPISAVKAAVLRHLSAARADLRQAVDAFERARASVRAAEVLLGESGPDGPRPRAA